MASQVIYNFLSIFQKIISILFSYEKFEKMKKITPDSCSAFQTGPSERVLNKKKLGAVTLRSVHLTSQVRVLIFLCENQTRSNLSLSYIITKLLSMSHRCVYALMENMSKDVADQL